MSMRGTAIVTDEGTTTLGGLVAAELRSTMARRRITGEYVAAQLGKSRAYVSRRLGGMTCVDLDDLEAIAEAIGVSPDSLLEPALAELRRLRATSPAKQINSEW